MNRVGTTWVAMSNQIFFGMSIWITTRFSGFHSKLMCFQFKNKVVQQSHHTTICWFTNVYKKINFVIVKDGLVYFYINPYPVIACYTLFSTLQGKRAPEVRNKARLPTSASKMTANCSNAVGDDARQNHTYKFQFHGYFGATNVSSGL